MMSLAMNAVRLYHTTFAEHYVCSFIRCKLQKLDTWKDFKQGGLSQLDKMKISGMYGQPCKAPRNVIVICPYW